MPGFNSNSNFRNNVKERFTNYDQLYAKLVELGSSSKRAFPLYAIGYWGYNSANLIAPFGEIGPGRTGGALKLCYNRYETISLSSGVVTNGIIYTLNDYVLCAIMDAAYVFASSFAFGDTVWEFVNSSGVITKIKVT